MQVILRTVRTDDWAHADTRTIQYLAQHVFIVDTVAKPIVVSTNGWSGRPSPSRYACEPSAARI